MIHLVNNKWNIWPCFLIFVLQSKVSNGFQNWNHWESNLVITISCFDPVPILNHLWIVVAYPNSQLILIRLLTEIHAYSICIVCDLLNRHLTLSLVSKKHVKNILWTFFVLFSRATLSASLGRYRLIEKMYTEPETFSREDIREFSAENVSLADLYLQSSHKKEDFIFRFVWNSQRNNVIIINISC